MPVSLYSILQDVRIFNALSEEVKQRYKKCKG